MRKSILFLILIVLFIIPVGASFAQMEGEEKGNLWADIWTDASFHKTNAERDNFNSFLIRSDGRLGLNVKEFPIKPYFIYLLAYSQDENYWNNNVGFGFGVRAFPFASYQPTSASDEWIKDVKFFVEGMVLSFLKDKETATSNDVKTYDYRVGLDLWHEWNQNEPNYSTPWAEIWANLSYRSTDFYQVAYNSYLLHIRQKIGIFLGILKPYLKFDLRYGGRSEPWWNYFFYGGGVRVEPFRHEKDILPWLEKFKMFCEFYGIAWIRDKDSRPASDLRFGIEFTYGR